MDEVFNIPSLKAQIEEIDKSILLLQARKRELRSKIRDYRLQEKEKVSLMKKVEKQSKISTTDLEVLRRKLLS